MAHLSDLHFAASTRTDDAVWTALLESLRPVDGRPYVDAMVVTGDIIDGAIRESFFSGHALQEAFTNARAYLYQLCETAGVGRDALFVVPGNHDVRAQGIMSSQAQADLFASVFAAHFDHALMPGLRAFIYPFDSNMSMSPLELAAGSVREEAFPRFKGIVAEAFQCAEWKDCARIALLHHHPMPIAATEHRTFENLEEYLLLRNAGMFMTEMVRRDFDLILHGHKHYPSMSRAAFIDDDGSSRSVAVVAAGSVSHGTPSYNVITLFDGGAIDVERRTRSGATYVTATARPTPLVPYAAARRQRFERLATAMRKPALRVEVHEKFIEIAEASGDAFVREVFSGARAQTEQPMERIEHRMSGDSAYLQTPVFDPPGVARWEAGEENCTEHWREGAMVFTPPLTMDDDVTFRRTTRYPNAIYFNKRDRLDATNQRSCDEELFHRVRYVCDRLILGVTFPPECFPSSMRLVVKGGDNARDVSEEKHCSVLLTRVEPSRTYVLPIDRPLPGFSYSFEWDLPREDPSEPVLAAKTANTALRVMEYLAEEPTKDRRESIVAALEALRAGFAAFDELRTSDTAALDVSLFLYDKTAQGLRAAYSTLAGSESESRTIMSGREIVGQTYRRRKPVVYVAEGSRDERVFVSDARIVAVAGIPLFYPIGRGRRIAVLTLVSRSRLTWLTQLEGNAAFVKWVAEEVWRWWRGFLREEVQLQEIAEN